MALKYIEEYRDPGVSRKIADWITLFSGPGCPVCVTVRKDIDRCIKLARTPGVIVATFGDMMRAPGTDSSLEQERADGNTIHVRYSVFDALDLARRYPDKPVVFLDPGVETSAPIVAASVLSAQGQGLRNHTVLSIHKRMMPVLESLMLDETVCVDGFVL